MKKASIQRQQTYPRDTSQGVTGTYHGLRLSAMNPSFLFTLLTVHRLVHRARPDQRVT